MFYNYEIKQVCKFGLCVYVVIINGTEYKSFLSIELALTEIQKINAGKSKAA